MQVKIHLHFTFRLEPLNELLCEEYRRVQLTTGFEPTTVEIHTQQAAPVVAMDDPIWVQHWYDLEHEVPSQILGIQVVWVKQVVEYALQHP